MKIAIVAGGETSSLVPYEDTILLKWGLNDLHSILPHQNFERWFEMHDKSNWTTCRFEDSSYIDGLKKLDIPIYVCEKVPELENSIRYPLEDVSRLLRDYFANTICYMLALAIYEGATEIHIYGVDMHKSTYHQLKVFMCLMYWIGIAEGRGIKVIIPETSMLYMPTFLYGGFNETV